MIASSGVDGAGKSTQIDMLREALSKQGVRARMFWASIDSVGRIVVVE